MRGEIIKRYMQVVACALSLLATAGVGAASGSAPTGGYRPGDIVRDGRAAAVVPPRGVAVVAHVTTDPGSDEDLMVSTDEQGEVLINEMDASEDPTIVVPDTPGNTGCNDSTWNLLQHEHRDGSSHRIKVYGTLHWKFNRQTTPSQTTPERAESALQSAIRNITNASNPCDMGDNVGASAQYDGDADANAAINADGACLNANGGSQVSFGDISDSLVLAVACEWLDVSRTPHDITQADVKIDNRSNWYAPGLESCDEDWSIEAVVTHERGHSFGLGHVSEGEHPHLTMSKTINGRCQDSESSLGKGDVLGLRELY